MRLPPLNIRRKVTLGVVAYLLALGVFGGVAAYNLKVMERKVRLVEVCDDFKSGILEVRRYEKNFLLYGHQDDLDQAGQFLHEAKRTLNLAQSLARWQTSRDLLQNLRSNLRDYEEGMSVLNPPPTDLVETERRVAHLRALGKELVDDSQRLTDMERQRILEIITELNANLLLSLASLVVLGAIMHLGTRRFVIQPLRTIEQTTRRIAEGDFQYAEVPHTEDEVASVLLAFNHMVDELERRQEHLVQAQKLSSIGTLTSGIAHQLNNPLNNIATSCHLLADELGKDTGEMTARMLSNIRQEVFRARDIVKGLLEFSRHTDFHRAQHPLRGVVERSLSLVSSQIGPGIEVGMDVPEDLIAFMDAQRIQEALINMLLNAAQAIETPRGSIQVFAEAGQREGFVRLGVRDTGKGIPKHQIEQIFDPFFSTKDVGKGTGLGLYVVYGIVQKHGGGVHIESNEGSGTTIIIDLPVSEEYCGCL